MYHINDLKKYSKCQRLYFLDSLKDNTSFEPYLRSDESYIDLLKEKLNITECFTGKVGDSNDEFFNNKDSYEWFIKTRFEHSGLRIKVPILHKENNLYSIYFIYYGTEIRELDYFTYRVTIGLLEKLGIIIDEAYLAYVNPNYVYHQKIDSDDLFIITNKYHNGRLINIILDGIVDYKEMINRIESSSLDKSEPVKTRACHLRSVCEHYDNCFKGENSLENDSILTLVSSQYKNEMFDNGIKTLKDVDVSKLEGNRVQYAQVMASRNGGLFVDKTNMKLWLNNLDERPISFIDFEWDRYLIPSYEGMKPLDVVPFEFALYIDNGSGELEHRTFISSGDCRKEFVETLIESLPKSGKILAYNAAGAEILRLKELALQFEEYRDELNSIIDRFVDLATPFVEGLVYDVRMTGNYSLKKLVSIVSDKSYKDLDIDDGMSAVFEWRSIDKGLDVDKDSIIDNLKEYCSLDAYGLYLVYTWLKSIVK